jgi:hypothetical protein
MLKYEIIIHIILWILAFINFCLEHWGHLQSVACLYRILDASHIITRLNCSLSNYKVKT